MARSYRHSNLMVHYSMHSRRLVHTTTITWLQWALLTPTCLLLDSGSGSSLLRQLVVGGGGLSNSSTANLTAPGLLYWYSVEETHLYYMLYEGIYQACFLKEVETQHIADRNEKYCHGTVWDASVQRYANITLKQEKCEENNFSLPFSTHFSKKENRLYSYNCCQMAQNKWPCRGKVVSVQIKKKTAWSGHIPILTDCTRFVGRLSFIVLSESEQSTAHPHTHMS